MADERIQHHLSALTSPGVTGVYGPPMTAAERRAADEEYRAQEAERTARVDRLVQLYELADGTVVRDAVNVYWRLNADIRGRGTNLHDAWWETFGDDGGWRLGDECPHGSERSQNSTECRIVKNCIGRVGPALPFTVVSH